MSDRCSAADGSRKRLCGACNHPVAYHRGGFGDCCALACECNQWIPTGTDDGEERRSDEETSATLASLRYGELPEGVGQWMTIDDAVLETIERLHVYDDQAPACEAFLRDLLERVRLWGRFEMWTVLMSGELGADELLAELRRRDARRASE
jgi:hypothetical protein